MMRCQWSFAVSCAAALGLGGCYGGLSDNAAEGVAEDGGGFTVHQLHVKNLPKSGRSTDDVMNYCGVSAKHIVEKALAMLELSAT